MTTPVPPGDGASNARARRRRRTRVAAAAGAVALAVGFVGRDWLATRDATSEAAARSDEVQVDLDRAADDLSGTRDRVHAGEANLRGQQALLATRQAERTDAQGTADATALWLSALQDQLATATAELDASSGRLDALQVCLAGVAEALNQVAARDTGGVAATVSEIEGSCAEAGVEL